MDDETKSESERLEKLLTDGWAEEQHRVLLLTDDQLMLMGDDLILMMMYAVGSSASIELEVDPHTTVLEDGTIIIEAKGTVSK